MGNRTRMNLPLPETTPAIAREERKRNLLNWITLGIILFTAVGVAATLYFRWGDSAQQSTTQHGVEAVVQSAKRADCRTQYNSDRSQVLEHAAIVERENVATFGSYLLGQGVTVDELAKNKAALDDANKAVAGLPALNNMVDKGYTLNGVKHPPCPVVR